MKQFFTVTLTILLSILIVGCKEKPSMQDDVLPSTASSSSASALTPPPTDRETNNVTYTGVVRPAGISIYMQGSHRLELEDGRFILLESDALDLNGYVRETVDVFGSIRPTVEGDAMIMRVESVKLQRSNSSVASEDESSEESEESSSESLDEDTVDDDVPDVDEESDVTSEENEPSPEMLAKVAKMSKENFAAANWTQKYCTGHVGFCVPIHRNWWFKSFGTTTTHYWHLEVGPEAVEKLRDGPISVNLAEGSLSDLGVSDGEIVTEKNRSVGYRLWTDNRHFEVEGDISLAEAVSYITENLQVYSEE